MRRSHGSTWSSLRTPFSAHSIVRQDCARLILDALGRVDCERLRQGLAEEGRQCAIHPQRFWVSLVIDEVVVLRCQSRSTGTCSTGAQVLLSTHLDRENSVSDGRLRPNEGVVLVVERKT